VPFVCRSLAAGSTGPNEGLSDQQLPNVCIVPNTIAAVSCEGSALSSIKLKFVGRGLLVGELECPLCPQ
jgi:hypothetical protein